MSARKRRAARRRLKAHDRGENRHNKGLMAILKFRRLSQERRGGARRPVIRGFTEDDIRQLEERQSAAGVRWRLAVRAERQARAADLQRACPVPPPNPEGQAQQ